MPAKFCGGTHTTSRAESVNSMIKQHVSSQSRLTDIFHAMSNLTIQICTNQQTVQRNQTQLFLNHPLLAELYELYSRFSFETMLH